MDLNKVLKDARDALRELVRCARDPGFALWAIYLLAVPVYVFKSGVPQPGDYLALLLPLVVKRRKPIPLTVPVRRALVAFTVYVVLLNILWSAVLGSWTLKPKEGFLLSPTFYIYNALMFFVVLTLYQQYREKFLWFTAKMLLISILVQVFVSSIHGPRGERATVMFNNANQLGFYALLTASMLLILQRRRYVSTVEVTSGLVSAVYLCLISASKAALGGIGLLAVFGMFVRLRTMLVVGTVLVLSLVVASPMLDAIHGSMHRVQNDTSHETFEERGYDRIVNNPEYLFTGAGEGGYERFADTTVIGTHEIHSSLGTMVFCYGPVGLIMFGVFVWRVIRRSGFRTWLLVAPSFAFGMTHQGLRSTLFWVQLALVVAMKCEEAAARARARSASVPKRDVPALEPALSPGT